MEIAVANQLANAGIPAPYERYRIPFVVPSRQSRYTPDFVLPHNGIIIETKGRFVSKDRTKHKQVQQQFPDLDIRFVFSNPNTRIGKKSTTTYADWCNRFGFKWAAVSIPQEWLDEPPESVRLNAINKILVAVDE